MNERLVLTSAHGIDPRCPMCGHDLVLVRGATSGYLLCSWADCSRPTAAAELLSEGETEHIVVLDWSGGYSIKHPIRERLDDELLNCWVGNHVAEFGPQYLEGGVFGPPILPDVPYRVYPVGEGEDTTTEWELLV